VPKSVDIRPGKFIMGCHEGRDDVAFKCDDGEKPAREVTIDRPFSIGKYEVTFSSTTTSSGHNMARAMSSSQEIQAGDAFGGQQSK